jgi:hypothetical protein
VWHEGVGIPPCVHGGTVARCETAFGRATRSKDDQSSVSWPKKGIEINLNRDRIRNLWVYFGTDGFVTFAGTGDHWIDAKATVEDVLRWYGPPESAFDFPGKAGVRETSLLYFKRGLYFDFKDGIIVRIAVVEPKVNDW